MILSSTSSMEQPTECHVLPMGLQDTVHFPNGSDASKISSDTLARNDLFVTKVIKQYFTWQLRHFM